MLWTSATSRVINEFEHTLSICTQDTTIYMYDCRQLNSEILFLSLRKLSGWLGMTLSNTRILFRKRKLELKTSEKFRVKTSFLTE